MSRLLLKLALVLVLGAATAPAAVAQSFWYSGPGFSVRVPAFVPPFVPPPMSYRWSVSPYGFNVEVDDPLPAYPSRPLYRLSRRELGTELGAACRQLERDLARVNTGDTWMDYLEPRTIREQVGDPSDKPPGEAAHADLSRILARFDKTAADASYRTIFRKPGFAAVHQLLSEYLLPPDERQRRRLVASYREFDRWLARTAMAASWRDHLRLPSAVAEGSVRPDADLLDELATLQARYDEAANSREFEYVRNLPGFTQTRGDLAQYNRMLSAIALQPDTEEIPPPTPDRASE